MRARGVTFTAGPSPAEPVEPHTLRAERLLGAHMPTAGGIVKALTGGHEIGCTAVQLFTANPRQWSAEPLGPAVAEQFRETQQECGIRFTVAHDSYLINLCAPDPAVLERSRQAFRGELERAEALGIPWVVTHMGAHLESGEEAGIHLLCESISQILRDTEGLAAGIALETTAGQGTCLGYTFEQIARVVEGCVEHPRVGVCLDTCHLFAAGYDIRCADGYETTMSALDAVIGFDKLRVIHANDAKKPLGSRVDRHEHLGRGQIGLDSFRRLVIDPRLLHVPVIVETPDAEKMHEVNLSKLRRLARGEEPQLRVTVRFFGHFSDFAPDGLEVEAPPASTIAALAGLLAAKDRRLVGIDTFCRAAVNEEYAVGSDLLHDGDTVAFIPPMSGG